MSPITLDVPDDLAEQLRSLPEQVPRILELGLRQLKAESQGGFAQHGLGRCLVFGRVAGRHAAQRNS